MHYLYELIAILNEMSPYLILGFLISGLLHIYVPKTLYSRFLHRKGFASVVGAAILGVPLPLCSCGVIPTAVSLKKEGASDGATVAFLVGTPQTGIDSILATYSLLGLPFAIIRPIASFVVAIFSGVFVDKLGKDNIASSKEGAHDVHCHCGHDHLHGGKAKNRFVAALRYGYVDMMQDFGKWLVIGLMVAAAITAFIPDSAFAMFKDYYFLNILLILIISAPMYICATGSVPIALSLIMKGVSPGAAFVLLMAGPATNIASLIILRREIGVRKTIIYLAAIIVGAIACAFVIDFVMPAQWFSGIGSGAAHAHDHAHDHSHEGLELIWWQLLSSLLFVGLFTSSMIAKYRNKGNHHGCCSHTYSQGVNATSYTHAEVSSQENHSCCSHSHIKNNNHDCCSHK